MNFNIKTKIRINGKKYASVDEMSDDVRQLYEKAMQGQTQKTASKIKFNGVEYSNIEEMPAEIRAMYEAVMGVVEAGPKSSVSVKSDPTPEQSQQIADAIAAGNKIEAIQLYRSFTGSDLKESKDFIDKLTMRLQESDPDKYPAKPPGKGCLVLLMIGILVSLGVMITSLI